MFQTGWLRHWWAQAPTGVVLIAVAVSVMQEPNLLGVIKVSMVLLFGVGGLGLLAASVATLRAARSTERPGA